MISQTVHSNVKFLEIMKTASLFMKNYCIPWKHSKKLKLTLSSPQHMHIVQVEMEFASWQTSRRIFVFANTTCFAKNCFIFETKLQFKLSLL